MAFKVLSPPDTDLRVLYNVSKPVGPKQSNREDDVLLVGSCSRSSERVASSALKAIPKLPSS
jgi:hypothetical protein